LEEKPFNMADPYADYGPAQVTGSVLFSEGLEHEAKKIK
jgi:hypothetical protein